MAVSIGEDVDDSLTSKENSLRKALSKKPKNGKIMSQLSSLIMEQYKICQQSDAEKARRLGDEAIQLAEQAIQVAPHRPFGYAALSVAARDWSDRKEALLRAADLSLDQYRLARIGLLVRLLIEEREEESRRVKGTIGKASMKHPKRRRLAPEETKLYKRLQKDLTFAWKDAVSYSESEQTFLSKHEFRLGQFFRKKLPEETNFPRARHHFEQSRIYRSSSHNEMATFWLATISRNDDNASNTTSMDKCPADYVVSLYSTFASRFDELLVEKLQYQTPTKLRRCLDSAVVKEKFQRVCDLGCGTGLSGLAFQDLIEPAGNMIGVDLSPEMLERAKGRGCYDQLHVGDVEATLWQLSPRSSLECSPLFDLILACDVFCYLGDLAPVFDAVSHALVVGGYFCFSTELLIENDESSNASAPFQLHSCARFSHRQSYIEYLVQIKPALTIVNTRVTAIRKNHGQDVEGLLVILRKTE